MNRAILIVICDFIVSTMLSFSTGHQLADNHLGAHGTTLDNRTAAIVLQELRKEQTRLEAERQALADVQFQQGFDDARKATLEEMSERLAESKAKTEMLERKLALTKETTGELSPQEIQKELEKEIKERFKLAQQEQDARHQLELLKQQNTFQSNTLAQTKGELAVRDRKLYENAKTLEEQAKLLQDREQRLADRDRLIKEREAELAQKDSELTQADTSLQNTKQNLAVKERELELSQGELTRLNDVTRTALANRQQFESALSFTRGKLSATERELAEARSRTERVQKLAESRELELKESQRKLENMQAVLKNAVTDLTQTKVALKDSTQKLAKNSEVVIEAERRASNATGELQATKAKLADAEEKLRSDVLMRYSEATMQLELKMQERRMLIPIVTESTLFLPVVNIAGTNCLIGDFMLLTGNQRARLHFNGIESIAYTTQPPMGGGKAEKLLGPLFAPKNECRVGLLKVNELENRKPLSALSISELKERGIQDLYLFKGTAFGKESCSLEGRVSVNFAKGDESLYIRNARGKSELSAEPGDFVLTKQGEFVAIVVAIEESDLGKRQEARCVVFPDNFNWTDVYVMPFSGSPELFADATAPVFKKIRELEDKKQ